MNARFQVFLNGQEVKITLRPGEATGWRTARMTEEGWESEDRYWHHQGDRVVSEIATDGVDCDGRLSSYYRCSCPVERLRSGYEGFPDWEKEEAGQRDYFAEAMGY